MPRPLTATIYPEHIAHNLSVIRARNPHAHLWAVVKANAYGHGIERIYSGMHSADGIAVLQIDEAERVRALGWRKPILMIEGAFELRDLEDYSRLRCWHVVHSHAQIDMLAAHKTTQPHHVFLKLNSGMNRLGFPPEQYASAYARLMALPQVEEVSHMTHFARADESPRDNHTSGNTSSSINTNAHHIEPSVTQQTACFERTTSALGGALSLSNSAAALRHQLGAHAAYTGEWIRAGIAMYGGSPDYPAHRAADWGLKPAMSLNSQIIATQHIQAGDHVGYGAAFTADKAMRIGIVACGYADGYPRHAPTGTPVLVNGQRTRILGRVSMDMIAVDLTELPDTGTNADIGSAVTLWGTSENGVVSDAILDADEVAHHAGTISYELFCALAERVRKIAA